MATNNAINIPLPADVSNGGFGAASLTDGGLLVGSGTGAVTALTVGTDGQVLVGNTGADPSWSATPSVTSISFDGNTNALSAYTGFDTFTPTLAFGGTSTAITYSVNAGNYVRIGNIVFFSLRIILTNQGTDTGNATVEGLPITSNISSSTFRTNATYQNITYATNAYPVGVIANASTSIRIQYNVTGSANTWITDTGFANDSRLDMSGFYTV
jgi:hypothetical protein